MKYVLIVLLSLFNLACSQHKSINNLPQAVTNNAVVLVEVKNGFELYSFNGLSSGKTWQDINKLGFRYKFDKWSQIKMPNESQPVLASTAVSINNKVYLLGGYTVAADHSEKSMPEVFELDTNTQKWKVATQMPIPVDDTVALVYANRYIYLISGWHDKDNVSDTQVYDTFNDKWLKATKFPAPAVFGHAGGIVDNKIIICDGVKVVPKENTRDFVSSPICMQGTINKSKIMQIEWKEIPHHSNTAYYRMAAVGDNRNNQVVFAGGSDNPYNYDGIGYNKVASKPTKKVLTYDLKSATWTTFNGLISENMDHRALLNYKNSFFIIGGMEVNQNVSNKIIEFKLPNNK